MNWKNRLRRLPTLALPVLLVATAGFASPAPQEKAAQQAKDTAKKTGTAIKDSWITMKVHSQFVPEDTLEGSDVNVDTRAGVVILTGTVPSAAARARAVAIAKATDGVTSVTDQLRIAAPEASIAGDAARKTGDAARKTGEATGDAARKTGEATGEATRKTGEAARDAGQATKEAAGTTGKAITDGWIKSKIAAKFVTEDSLDNSDVNINISKGVVTLNGAVQTPVARTRAEEIVKATDGVKSVKNNLKVNPAVK
jgi:hyperosmotically inducible periplasmic protein